MKWRHCKRWTAHEDAVVRECYGVVDTEDIAERLGRTFVAVASRAWFFKRKRRQSLYSMADDLLLRQLRQNGWTAKQIAMRMQRSRGSVIGRLYRLGLCQPRSERGGVREPCRPRGTPSLPRVTFLERGP